MALFFVASRFGPHFCDWQLAQSPEESWRECHLHARNLLGEGGYLNLLGEVLREGDGDVVNFLTLWLGEETESQGGGFRLINAGRACIFEVRKPVRRIWPMNSVRFGRAGISGHGPLA